MSKTTDNPLSNSHDDTIETKTVAVICAAVAAASGKSLSQLRFKSIRRAGSAENAGDDAARLNFNGLRRFEGARSLWANSAAMQVIAEREKYY